MKFLVRNNTSVYMGEKIWISIQHQYSSLVILRKAADIWNLSLNGKFLLLFKRDRSRSQDSNLVHDFRGLPNNIPLALKNQSSYINWSKYNMKWGKRSHIIADWLNNFQELEQELLQKCSSFSHKSPQWRSRSSSPKWASSPH